MPQDVQCLVAFDIRDSQKVLLPNTGSRISSVPNFSRILTSRPQGKDVQPYKKRKILGHSTMRNPSKPSGVKRWDAVSHKRSDWDGLRRDSELWQQDGDCLVHLYGQGKSKRGASLKVLHSDLVNTGCESLLHTYLAPRTSSTESLPARSPSSSSEDGEFELYIPAPEDALRDDAFRWHLTTRNFFAWVSDKPVVGAKLGRTLIDLLERITLFCPDKERNIQGFLAYARRQRYLDFNDSPDYALALLNFAEKFKLRDLWIDAFAHCVGMNDKLDLSPEFDDVSRVTKALITRAYLEMDLHVGRVSRALRTFLEDELAPAYLGLPNAARAHLERFRSFLHSFYVNKFGYWPPENGPMLDKSILREMNNEFQALYDYLVDTESSTRPQVLTKVPTGGICAFQNVEAFNTRHNYEPLPHCMPLLPDCASREFRTSSQKGLRALRLSSKAIKFEEFITARSALATATNATTRSECRLVQDYMYFEQELAFKSEERLSVVDARKVRWIVIYSVLQMLISATRAPREVNEADASPYHLCLLTTGTPPWPTEDKGSQVTQVSLAKSAAKKDDQGAPKEDSEDESAMSIHPDCENGDYFSHKLGPRRFESDASLKPQPLRINTGTVGRSSSIRSLHKSLTSNFSLPSRRSSLRSSGLFGSQSAAYDLSSSEPSSAVDSKRLSGYSFAINEDETVEYLHPRTPDASFGVRDTFPLPEARTPTLDVFMLDPSRPDSPSTPASSSSSNFSPFSYSSHMWGYSTDDLDTISFDDHRSSQGIYSMDHESVCGDLAATPSRKCSGANSPSSPAATITPTSAAAATAKLVAHAGLAPQHEPQQQFPAWWSMGVNSSPRASSTSSSKQRIHDPFGVSVPQDVPEDDVIAFGTHSRRVEETHDVEAMVDIFDAMNLLPANLCPRD